MEITFLGTGVALPQRERVQSGLIVDVEGRPLLFDCGCGVLNRIQEAGFEHTAVDTVVLSHLHLDHVSDLLGLLKANWLSGKSWARIYGPKGLKAWFSAQKKACGYFMEELELDIREITSGEEFTPLGFECEIQTAKAEHSVPTLAFHLNCAEGELAISGDTTPSREVLDLAAGADLLIHECSYPLGGNAGIHTTPDSLAGLLKE
ncbi:MAG: MBL fold metallo-hydrolase, partial [Methanosarcinaceae archaeon]|nr:MBL fold metallo-hydrolase [Methanosarcinaceae archaeon]